MKLLNSNPQYKYDLYVCIKDGTIIKIDQDDEFYYDEAFITIRRPDGFVFMVPNIQIREIRSALAV